MQLSLFGDDDQLPHGNECAIDGCTNPRRRVSAAKYCAEHATCINYQLTGLVPEPAGLCLLCDNQASGRRRLGRHVTLCSDHRHLRDLLNNWRYNYRLTDDRIRALVTEAVCWICGGSIAWRFNSFAFGPAVKKIAVDHDRRCCPTNRSCGECVRGLSHQSCNSRLGQAESLLRELGPERMRKLIDELG